MPRLTYVRIKNCRALRDVEFRNLTPLTVLIGSNGSGKPTVLGALAFLAEAVKWEFRRSLGLRASAIADSYPFAGYAECVGARARLDFAPRRRRLPPSHAPGQPAE